MVTVDSEVAEKYRSASKSERLKLDWLVSLHLRNLMGPRRPLEETMRELSQQAQERGLTPEILQSILDDE
jgi:hypothetical protein